MRPEIGAVGAKLYYDNDTIQHGGVIVGLGGVAGHSHKHLPRDNPGYFRRLCLTQNLSAVTAACLVVRRDSYLKVGGLDEVNLTIAFNDVDFCLKLWALGLRNVWTPHAELYHHESVSRGPEDSPEKVARFKKEMTFMKEKWGERLRRDPYYSPMLTLDWENFTPDFRNSPRKPWIHWKNAL
jgi:GT2 family glycosyltransferase